MTARDIDGRAIASAVEADVRESVIQLAARGVTPALVAVRVGDDPASELYVRNKAAKAKELGLESRVEHLPEQATTAELLELVRALNDDPAVDGILIQLPLPAGIDEGAVLRAVDPAKDVDGFHPINVGNLGLGRPALVPCTPAGVIRLIDATGISMQGLHAVVIGRSNIVGKPVAALLLQRDATVTIAHSRTAGLPELTCTADILVAAAGRPFLVTGEMVKRGAVVIDVGINRVVATDPLFARLPGNKQSAITKRGYAVVGDVDYEAVREVAGWITPVPGGAGPMTIAMLMKNTVTAAESRRR